MFKSRELVSIRLGTDKPVPGNRGYRDRVSTSTPVVPVPVPVPVPVVPVPVDRYRHSYHTTTDRYRCRSRYRHRSRYHRPVPGPVPVPVPIPAPVPGATGAHHRPVPGPVLVCTVRLKLKTTALSHDQSSPRQGKICNGDQDAQVFVCPSGATLVAQNACVGHVQTERTGLVDSSRSRVLSLTRSNPFVA